MEYEKVVPRITDPEMQPKTFPGPEVPLVTPVAQSTGVVKGLFTSVYENKIIVLIIVVSIIIIGIIAYIILRKNDDYGPPPATQQQTVQQVAQQAVQQAAQQAVQQQQPQMTQPQQQQPQMVQQQQQQQQAHPVAFAKLAELYQRGKLAGKQSVAQQAQQPSEPAEDNIAETGTNSKSEEEIQQLMEDQPADEEHTNTSITDALDNEPAIATLPTESQRPGFCTELLKSGKYCRNRALSSNKCRTHGG